FGSVRFQDVVYEAINMLGSFTATDSFPKKNFHDFDNFYQKIIDERFDPQRVILGHEDIID
ncbi:hypothetical protein MKX01_027402, partial [Papaver californicum]